MGAVLFIACVNITALLMARGGTRVKEIATRMALGSGRAAVVRQLMVESVVLAAVGGALGLLWALAGLEGLKAIGGTTFSEWDRATLDGRTIVVSFALAGLTSVLFGILPAWQAGRVDLQQALTDGGSRSIAGGSRHLARRLLVVAEVALGLIRFQGAVTHSAQAWFGLCGRFLKLGWLNIREHLLEFSRKFLFELEHRFEQVADFFHAL